MQEVRTSYLTLCLAGLAALWCLSATNSVAAQVTATETLRCEALLDSRNSIMKDRCVSTHSRPDTSGRPVALTIPITGEQRTSSVSSARVLLRERT